MNCKRFTARTSRDALALVRQAFGEDAVVLSTKPCPEGVEVLAMPPDGMAQIEKMAASAPRVSAPAEVPAKGKGAAATPVEEDVKKLSMSTLSFQDFVRERMLKRRREAIVAEQSRFPDDAISATGPIIGTHHASPPEPVPAARREPVMEPPTERNGRLGARMGGATASAPVSHAAMPHPAAMPDLAEPPMSPAVAPRVPQPVPLLHDPVPAAAEEIRMPAAAATAAAPRMPAAPAAAPSRDQEEMLKEVRQLRALIDERFGALAFMEKLQRHPAQARLTQKLLDGGFSPALIRKLAEALPADVLDETGWATHVLERNLVTGEHDGALEDIGGVYALIGPTGVGKTTSTAKIAAAFATKYGAANLGLITLDAYRVGAHEQLRAYGRILGVPVHTAHDRASLEDLLELLAGKKMVLIDTAGMAQRDTRTRELMEMLQHRSIRKLLVLNASSQGETIEDVVISYRGTACAGVVLSKLDEAVKLGPALDALIRHKLKVVGVANGQRVPEDWHRLSANALVHRALRAVGGSAYKLDSSDVNLIFAAPRGAAGLAAAAAA